LSEGGFFISRADTLLEEASLSAGRRCGSACALGSPFRRNSNQTQDNRANPENHRGRLADVAGLRDDLPANNASNALGSDDQTTDDDEPNPRQVANDAHISILLF
jgi:hypothetical protein